MFKLVSFAVISLVAAVPPSPTSTPGAGIAISADGLKNAKNVVVPLVFSNLDELKIPSVPIPGYGSFDNLDIHLPMPAESDIQLNLDSASNGLEVFGQNLGMNMTADFVFKKVITVTGSANIKIKNIGLDLELGFDTQADVNNGELAPKLSVVKNSIKINPDDIDVELSGSLVAKIAGIFIPIIKNSIIPGVVTKIEDAITAGIANASSELSIYGTQAVIPFLAGVTIDYAQFNAGPKVTDDKWFAMDINGTFFDQDDITVSQFTPAVFPAYNADGKTAQGYLTDYVLNTMFDAGFRTGNTLNITEIISKFSNLTVTTDDLALVVP